MRPNIRPMFMLLLLNACDGGEVQVQSHARPDDSIRASTMPGPRAAFFELDTIGKARLLEALQTVREGEAIESVVQKLGKPTSDDSVAAKENGTFRTRVMKYYIRRYDSSTVNERLDEYVALYFDSAGHLTSKHVQVQDAKKP